MSCLDFMLIPFTYSALFEASIFAHSLNGSGNKSSGVIGLKPYTSNGHVCVVEWTARLYENSTWDKKSSHSIRFFLTIVHSSMDNVRFTTSICLSVCG